MHGSEGSGNILHSIVPIGNFKHKASQIHYYKEFRTLHILWACAPDVFDRSLLPFGMTKNWCHKERRKNVNLHLKIHLNHSGEEYQPTFLLMSMWREPIRSGIWTWDHCVSFMLVFYVLYCAVSATLHSLFLLSILPSF